MISPYLPTLTSLALGSNVPPLLLSSRLPPLAAWLECRDQFALALCTWCLCYTTEQEGLQVKLVLGSRVPVEVCGSRVRVCTLG